MTKRATLPALPHSNEAEIAFLGAILLDSAGAREEMERVDSADFFLPQHQIIYRAIKSLKTREKPTNDLVLLYDLLASSNELEAAGGAEYVASLFNGLFKIANLSQYAEIIKTKADARKLICEFDRNISRLLTANGDLPALLHEIRSAHIGMDFGHEKASGLFRTAADLAAESNSLEFIVEPYLLAGAVTELVAKIKAGKTTYVLGEIVRQALDKGAVVYLTEQPSASFRVALERAGLLGVQNLFMLPFNAVIGMEWRDIARIATEKCRQVGAILLVIDTLSHFSGLDGDSENDSGAAISCMKPLQEAAATGIAVLTIRHERKSGGEIGDAGRGSSAFGGAADTLLTLRRVEGRARPTLRKIECVSRFEGLPAVAIYEYVEGRYKYLGTECEISEREAESMILSSAPECEKAKTLDDLLDGSEVARTTAQRVVRKLVAEGKVTQIGRGRKGNPFRYFLTEKSSAQTTYIPGRNESADQSRTACRSEF